MASVTTDDQTDISYRIYGDGPLNMLCVHGWMVSGAVFDEMLSAINHPDLRVIVPDHRGTGESGRPDSGYTLERYAEDMVAVADDAGASTYVLVGHSMGGQIAQLCAAHHPERTRGLVLYNTVPATGMELPDDAHELFVHSGEDREAQRSILDMACLELSEEDRERLLDEAAKIPAACIRESYEAWTGGGFADELEKIEAPTLVVGTDDPFLPADFLGATVVDPIPRARFAYIPGPGHYPQVERPVESAALLDAFVAGLAVG
jgi:pimeloyl-ACP methyl ester carboxylesterase